MLPESAKLDGWAVTGGRNHFMPSSKHGSDATRTHKARRCNTHCAVSMSACPLSPHALAVLPCSSSFRYGPGIGGDISMLCVAEPTPSGRPMEALGSRHMAMNVLVQPAFSKKNCTTCDDETGCFPYVQPARLIGDRSCGGGDATERTNCSVPGSRTHSRTCPRECT